ncbi:MAG: efflux RND transporter periplasmic adaptor subunit [Gammaproteobacteria bacterium]|nr:efflux RND transporter periplasmic adaptor subunit [Gammaproteobacteria bacterium]
MKKKLPIVIVVLIIALAAGIYFWRHRHATEASNGTELVLYGNVDIREVRVAFNGSEHVSEMLVDEGAPVKAGQLLARLQTDRLEAAVNKARADVAAARAEAHAATLNYQRIHSLSKRKLASKSDADVAEANSSAATARVAAAEAVLTQADQALKDANLYAPVDGVIRERLVQPGDFVTPQAPVYTLAMTDPVWVRTYLPESYLGKVRPGAPAQITTDSYPGKVYEGWVGAISPTAEFTPKSVETPDLRTRLVYQVRVFACNPQDELRLGMPATVSIALTDTAAAVSAETRCHSSATK